VEEGASSDQVLLPEGSRLRPISPMTFTQMSAAYRYFTEATTARSALCANPFFARFEDTKSAIIEAFAASSPCLFA
jgi:hypothetical protein